MVRSDSDQSKRDRVRRVVADATLPYGLATVAKRYLKDTPEYERARREKRARAWLDAESLSVGHEMADVLRDRLARASDASDEKQRGD